MSEKLKTRKATAAERLAARALGKPEPDEVEVETRSAGEQHYARLLQRQRAASGEDNPPAA